MTDLEKLTQLFGSPKATAERLKINLRTYWNYRAGKAPEAAVQYIEAILAVEEFQRKMSKSA